MRPGATTAPLALGYDLYAIWTCRTSGALTVSGTDWRRASHAERERGHGESAQIVRHELRAWAVCLTARLAAGRLGDRHAGTGPAHSAGSVRRRARPHARTRRGEVAGCGGHGGAAGRARGPPLRQRRAHEAGRNPE